MSGIVYTYYVLQNAQTNCIYRKPDGAFIPIDPNNGDYRNYLVWLSQGNTATIIDDAIKAI